MMKLIVDPAWGPAPINQGDVSTRVFTYALPAGEVTVTLQRRGAWAAGGPFIYKDASLLPTVCGQAGCWSDRVALEVVLLDEREGEQARPPRLEPW